jgi:hypothetical protein
MIPAPVLAAIFARRESGFAFSMGGADATPFWPLRSHLELGALDSAVPCARMHAKQVVIEWGLRALANTTELIVSELITNGIRASDPVLSPAVRLWLFSDRRRVLVQVWDGSSKLPVPQDADPDSESGRGLLLVQQLSSDWGLQREPIGKVVWALIGPA